MNKILVAYATFAGSTSEVARVVGEEIARSGAQVEVLPLDQVSWRCL
jgi:menaquinone-dependent protoporphyrinogen IX oxidase